MTAAPTIEVPCVLLRVSQLYRAGMDVDEIYDITRGWWRMGANREKADYALAVADGVVRGAFRVLGWRARREGDENFHHDAPGKPRWGFDGEPAEELDHLMGTDITHLFPPGSQNPVRYLNLDSAGEDVEQDRVPTSTEPGPTDDLSAACNRLVANPVLHLSLGSKELFHSNLLGWFLENDETLTREVFARWIEPGACTIFRVHREWHHLDLVIELPGAAPIVVENKVFSLPEEDQLDRYSVENIPALGLGDASRVLLSLSDPGWSEGSYNGWDHCTWEALAATVCKHIQVSEASTEFLSQLALHWYELIRDLHDVVELTRPQEGEGLLLDGDRRALLDEVRIGDAVEKARVRRFRHDLAQALGSDRVAGIELASNFGRSGPLVDVKVPLADGGLVGWQLQGLQWKRFVITPEGLHGKSPAQQLARIEYAQTHHLSWFDLDLVRDAVPHLNAPSAEFKHFAPGFLYDYVKVPEATNGQLLKLAVAETERAIAYASTWRA